MQIEISLCAALQARVGVSCQLGLCSSCGKIEFLTELILDEKLPATCVCNYYEWKKPTKRIYFWLKKINQADDHILATQEKKLELQVFLLAFIILRIHRKMSHVNMGIVHSHH